MFRKKCKPTQISICYWIASAQLCSVFFLTFVFFTATASTAWALFAFTADSYEKKPTAFDAISTVLILAPKVVTGDYQLIRKDPVSEDSLAYQLVAKSVILGASAAFTDRGYNVSEDSISVKPEVWSEVIKFTDSGRPVKRKMLPYFAVFDKLQIKDPKPDALVFLQIYGEFGSLSSENNNMKSDYAVSAAGAAVSGALTGFLTVVPTATSEYDYKISIFDAKSGQLLWFQEGHRNNTDVGSVGRFSDEIKNLLRDCVPLNKKPTNTAKKFKKKRSEIAKLNNGETNEKR